MRAFRRCVQHYRSHHKIKTFTCSDQFRCMAFAQLTYIDSFQTQQTNICHMSIHGGMSHNTLANANQTRDWRIYVDFAQSLIHIARTLYLNQDFGIKFYNTVYAFDATTIVLLIPEAGAFYVTLATSNLQYRRQDTNLDCRIRVCSDYYRKIRTQHHDQSLYNSTDFKCHRFRANAFKSSIFRS